MSAFAHIRHPTHSVPRNLADNRVVARQRTTVVTFSDAAVSAGFGIKNGAQYSTIAAIWCWTDLDVRELAR